jgi:hypothetical protein
MNMMESHMIKPDFVLKDVKPLLNTIGYGEAYKSSKSTDKETVSSSENPGLRGLRLLSSCASTNSCLLSPVYRK